MAFMTLYPPPANPNGTARPATTATWKYAAKVAKHLSVRTDLIVGVNANGHIGPDIVSNDVAGPHRRKKGNNNGSQVYHFANNHNMTITNTMHKLPPTFHHGNGNNTSHIGYISMPQRLWQRSSTSKPLVDRHGGNVLQLVKFRRRVDHRPVGLSCRTPKLRLHQLQPTHGTTPA